MKMEVIAGVVNLAVFEEVDVVDVVDAVAGQCTGIELCLNQTFVDDYLLYRHLALLNRCYCSE